MAKPKHEAYSSSLDQTLSPEEELYELQEVFGNGSTLHSYNRVMPDGLEAPEALLWLGDQVSDAAHEGKHIGLVAGAYDVPHDNHEWYIRNCRAQLARRVLYYKGLTPTPERIMRTMTNESLELIVSIDSDEALNLRKGGKAEKGGIPRPVYPWVARAHRIAGYSFEDPFAARGEVHHVADIVSKECTVNYEGTPMQCAATLAKYLKSVKLLDEYLVFDEHPQDIENARALGFEPIILRQAVRYATDPRTGKGYSSSGIIKQIRGNA